MRNIFPFGNKIRTTLPHTDEEKSLLKDDPKEDHYYQQQGSSYKRCISDKKALRWIKFSFLLIIFIVIHIHLQNQCFWSRPSFGRHHDIACQIKLAEKEYHKMINSQSKSIEEAITTYRRRYNREPPKGFEEWVTFALEQNSTIIDDYDILERNLAPFRKLTGDQIKARIQSALRAGGLTPLIVKNGTVSGASTTAQAFFRPVVDRLPGFIIPFNEIDEPKVIGYSTTPELESDVVQFTNTSHAEGISTKMAYAACSSPSSSTNYSSLYPSSSQQGTEIRSSWLDKSKDICLHPEMKHLHGFFQTPGTFIYSTSLVPVVSYSVMSTFGDIIGPPTCYYSGTYSTESDGDTIAFADKIPTLYWRGSMTGMWTTKTNWYKGHRQRFILYIMRLRDILLNPLKYSSRETPAKLNTTRINYDDEDEDQLSELASLKPWNFDVKSTASIQCDDDDCKDEADTLVMGSRDGKEVQYKYKYALDMDGNCMSCRYYRLLESNAVVFKQSINLEWHDERLIPWYHFVPISMEMDELPAVLDFFINDKKGDYYGEKIATASKSFAKSSLRLTDATVYWYRFALEYARLFE